MLRKCYGIKFKTKKKLKTQKDKKTSFPKEKDRKSRLIQIGIEENNDHTRVMRKIRFWSSVKEILNPNLGVWGVILPTPFSFSLNSKTVKVVTCHFAAFSNVLLETIVPNLASLTRPN